MVLNFQILMSVLLEIIAVIQMLSVITLMEGSTVLVRKVMKEMVHPVKVCNIQRSHSQCHEWVPILVDVVRVGDSYLS